MRILLLSAYDAASHRQWREGLVAHLPHHQWSVLTLPDRHFSWRIRGNALAWAMEQCPILNRGYDLIVATSMVDLATLKGIAPELAATPSLLYFHENQFDYPVTRHSQVGVEAQITSIYSALAATRLLFNSAYNRDTFLDGARTLLARLPDHAPAATIDTIAAKSDLLPVPLPADIIPTDTTPAHREQFGTPITLLWNHRWEYDKGPELLHRLLQALEGRLDYRIHIVGHAFRKRPEAFDAIARECAAHLGSWGHIEQRSEYLQLLRDSDIVLSTALHDFQGIAMQEAIAAGCLPLAPDRLAYPEYIPEACRYPDEADAEIMAARLIELATTAAPRPGPDGKNRRPELAEHVQRLRIDAAKNRSMSRLSTQDQCRHTISMVL